MRSHTTLRAQVHIEMPQVSPTVQEQNKDFSRLLTEICSIAHESLGCSQPCQLILECSHRCVRMCSQKCHCTCGAYLTLRQKSVNFELQSEAHLHMDFEEILLNEAGQGSRESQGSRDHPSRTTRPGTDRETYQPPDAATRQGRFDEWRRVVRYDAKRRDGASSSEGGTEDTASGELIPLARSEATAAHPAVQLIKSTWKPTKLVDGRRTNAGPTSVFQMVHPVQEETSGRPVEVEEVEESQASKQSSGGKSEASSDEEQELLIEL